MAAQLGNVAWLGRRRARLSLACFGSNRRRGRLAAKINEPSCAESLVFRGRLPGRPAETVSRGRRSAWWSFKKEFASYGHSLTGRGRCGRSGGAHRLHARPISDWAAAKEGHRNRAFRKQVAIRGSSGLFVVGALKGDPNGTLRSDTANLQWPLWEPPLPPARPPARLPARSLPS